MNDNIFSIEINSYRLIVYGYKDNMSQLCTNYGKISKFCNHQMKNFVKTILYNFYGNWKCHVNVFIHLDYCKNNFIIYFNIPLMSHVPIDVGKQLYRFMIRQLYVKNYIFRVDAKQFVYPYVVSCKRFLLEKTIEHSLYLLSFCNSSIKIKELIKKKCYVSKYPQISFRNIKSCDIKKLIKFYNDFCFNNHKRCVEKNDNNTIRLLSQDLPFNYSNSYISNDYNFIRLNLRDIDSYKNFGNTFYKLIE